MEVNQIYTLANDVAKEVLGEEGILQEDLSNVVDLGNTIQNAGKLDRYVKSLIDHIGKTIFVNRPYSGSAPSVLMDAWEYGSILEKITVDKYPEATENDTWQLEDGKSYDPNIFTEPKISAKFFNNKNTFEIPMSFAERQVKSAFDSAGQLNAFFSMIETSIQNAMTIRIDGLVRSTINNMSAQIIDGGNGPQVVDLLALYNARFGTSLTKEQFITTPEAIRWAVFYLSLYEARIKTLSTLFNAGAKERFTAGDNLKVVLLDEFKTAASIYLQGDTFHNDCTALPQAESVAFWQGSGENYAFADTSKIDVKHGDVEVSQDGIIGVMFDRDALGVTCLDKRVTSNYNPKGEFLNNWYKFDAGYFNDLNENFVVFVLGLNSNP